MALDRRFLRSTFAAILTLSAVPALAQALDYDNTRPVTIIDTVGQPSLQSIVDSEFGSGWGDVNLSQSNRGVFKTATTSGVGFETVIAQYGAVGASNYRFGIWFGTEASNLLHRDLFLGGVDTGYSLPIKISAGKLQVFADDIANCGTVIQCGTLNNSLVDPKHFGFYFEKNGERRYSLDQLNAGQASVLSYQLPSTSNWVLAYEDGVSTEGADFNDYVVSVTSVVAVPEPSEWLMMVAGLAMVTGIAKRRRDARV